MNNLIGFVTAIVYILLVFLISKPLQSKGEEVSRKFVHIALCNIWFIYLIFIDSLWVACILPAAFILINILSYKFKIIKSMERENNDGFGTVYYAVSILLVTIFSYVMKKPIIGLPGILVMGYGDGFAAIIGKRIKSKEYKIGNTTKTLAGSVTMFVISLVITSVIFGILNVNYLFIKALGIAAIATLFEAVSIKGLDNITVPIITTVLAFLAL